MGSSSLTLTAAAIGVLGSTFAMPTTASAVTKLKAASCFPIGSPPGRPFEALVKAINEAGKGVVDIKLVGGAPAIGSPFTLTQKMSKGIFDMVGCTEAYFGNVLPEAPVFRLAEHTYADLRKNGGWDYMANLMGAKNIRMIARYYDFGPFHLWLSKKIDKPDLKGLHLRVAPIYTAFFKKLGATVQTAALPQIYTLMENNTVQGYGWPTMAFVPPWAKVTKYRVEPGFYTSTLFAMANQKKWNSIPQDAKNLINKIAMDFESKAEASGPKFTAALKKRQDWMAEQGMEVIEFKGADRAKWSNTAKEAAWAEVLARSPNHGPKLMKLFTK